MINGEKDFRDLVFYQIYPRSFCDSNNDGIGDINGIISKLDYLVDLGVNAVWLSPCYKSPNKDNGYDISDYRDIAPEYGTLEDFKNMVIQMKKRGIRLIMDFVANHTSSEHFWFCEAKKSRNNKYRDYYYWSDKPKNDWQSCFGGSAWELDSLTGQYYLHSYAVSQPDLNWENPQVRAEMKAVLNFWIELGVDGFRCDVLDQIAKDFASNLNGNGQKLHEYIKELLNGIRNNNIFTVGECWGANSSNIVLLCGSERQELSTVFQFEHVCLDRNSRFESKDYNLNTLKTILVKWQNFTQDNNLLYSIFMENHDQPRMLSRFGDNKKYRYQNATMLACMFNLLRGIPFVFQGQEIGITNSHYQTIDAFDDIETVNYFNSMKGKIEDEKLIEKINFGSRDNARRPMPWNSQDNGGFSQVRPWIQPHNEYKEINVEADTKQPKSIHSFYKKLIGIRKENDAVILGSFVDATCDNDNCFVYNREYDGAKITVVCNFETSGTINIDTKNCKLILCNYDNSSGDNMYQPFETRVYISK